MITKSPEIIAVICIPTEVSSQHTYVVFDSHSRPNLHPNGSAFLFFPNSDLAAQYLAELLRVDESLLRQGDLQWQSEMLTTFSAHLFSSIDASEATAQAPHLMTPWSMLYETSVDLVQARGRIASAEQQIADLRRENAQLKDNPNAVRSELEDQAASHSAGNRGDQHYSRPRGSNLNRTLDPIEMTDEQYSNFWESGGTGT